MEVLGGSNEFPQRVGNGLGGMGLKRSSSHTLLVRNVMLLHLHRPRLLLHPALSSFFSLGFMFFSPLFSIYE